MVSELLTGSFAIDSQRHRGHGSGPQTRRQDHTARCGCSVPTHRRPARTSLHHADRSRCTTSSPGHAVIEPSLWPRIDRSGRELEPRSRHPTRRRKPPHTLHTPTPDASHADPRRGSQVRGQLWRRASKRQSNCRARRRDHRPVGPPTSGSRSPGKALDLGSDCVPGALGIGGGSTVASGVG